MVFQDPMTSLNPVLKIGYQLGEAIKTHYPKETNDEGQASAWSSCSTRRRPEPGDALRPVPARVLRRHAPAGDDRDGDRELAVAAHRRRADDRARRDDPGAGARGAEAVQAETNAATILITHDLGIVAGCATACS